MFTQALKLGTRPSATAARPAANTSGSTVAERRSRGLILLSYYLDTFMAASVFCIRRQRDARRHCSVHRLEGVDVPNVGSHYVVDVPSGQYQVVLHGGGGQQAIYDRYRIGDSDETPALSDFRRNR